MHQNARFTIRDDDDWQATVKQAWDNACYSLCPAIVLTITAADALTNGMLTVQ